MEEKDEREDDRLVLCVAVAVCFVVAVVVVFDAVVALAELVCAYACDCVRGKSSSIDIAAESG